MIQGVGGHVLIHNLDLEGPEVHACLELWPIIFLQKFIKQKL